jgi:RNAse (barnase) inhibitor barstar
MPTSSTIILDAINWTNKYDFYYSYCKATTAPKWFGMNLDALCDSFRGGICQITPEKMIIRNLTTKIREYFENDFWKEIENICKEECVEIEIYDN